MIGEDLPGQASVVVIGGGIMGCSTLYHLARAGISDAILLERNKLTSGTTWHSAAQVRALRSSRNLTNLIKYSIDLYSALEAETGQATGWINKGSLSIATSQDRLTHTLRQKALADAFGVEATAVSSGEAKERWPLMNADDVLGAVWSPDDGRVNPSDLCAALTKGARARGARIYEETAVTAIKTKDGRVVGLETTRGKVGCDAVALCTGLWSRRMADLAGVSLPVWPCEHFFMTWAISKKKPFFVGGRSLALRDRHLSRRKLVGFTIEDSGVPLPQESNLVMRDSEMVGFVTSVVRSPSLNKTIGLAYTARDASEPGSPLAIRQDDGTVVEARVVAPHFYDPDNARQEM